MKKHVLLMVTALSLATVPSFANSVGDARQAVREAASAAGAKLAPERLVQPVRRSQIGQVAPDSADAVLEDAETVAETAALKISAVPLLETGGHGLGLSEARLLVSSVQKALEQGPDAALGRKAWLNKAASQLALAAGAVREARLGSLIGAKQRSNLRSEPVPSVDESKLEVATGLVSASQVLLKEASK